jgi:hypothetical protein
MTRDLDIERGGFPIYTGAQIDKVNAMRRVKSRPDFRGVPTPTKGQVLFTTAESMHDEPASCYNCLTYNKDQERCKRIGPDVVIRKFTKGGEDGNPIEFWPCCSMQDYGTPSSGAYFAHDDPDYLGLIWINAPRPGQESGGANCGGVSGGDDCDSYLVDSKEAKWDSPIGFCRALQSTVAAGDVCTMWTDDDLVTFQEAQTWLKQT